MKLKKDCSEQKLRGAYYTPSQLAGAMVKLFASQNISTVLEPSCGDGVFLDSLKNQKLLDKVQKLTAVEIEPDEAEKTVVTPLVAAILFLVFFVALSLLEVRTERYFAVVDGLLFFVAGIGGCILFFLCFVSEHPCTCPNWNLIWIQPLHLLSPILYVVKKWRKVFYYYHFINFVAILLFVLCCSFIPQHFNLAVIPLAFSLLLRSGMVLYRAKSENRTLANR